MTVVLMMHVLLLFQFGLISRLGAAFSKI